MNFQLLNLLFRLGNDFSHRKTRPTGLSDTECKLCSYIYGHALCSQDEAGQELGIDKTTVTKALQTLENKGILQRETCADDRRKKLLTLTESGKKTISDIADLHEKWFTNVLSCLNADEQANFEDYLRRLLAEAEKLKNNEQ